MEVHGVHPVQFRLIGQTGGERIGEIIGGAGPDEDEVHVHFFVQVQDEPFVDRPEIGQEASDPIPHLSVHVEGVHIDVSVAFVEIQVGEAVSYPSGEDQAVQGEDACQGQVRERRTGGKKGRTGTGHGVVGTGNRCDLDVLPGITGEQGQEDVVVDEPGHIGREVPVVRLDFDPEKVRAKALLVVELRACIPGRKAHIETAEALVEPSDELVDVGVLVNIIVKIIETGLEAEVRRGDPAGSEIGGFPALRFGQDGLSQAAGDRLADVFRYE